MFFRGFSPFSSEDRVRKVIWKRRVSTSRPCIKPELCRMTTYSQRFFMVMSNAGECLPLPCVVHLYEVKLCLIDVTCIDINPRRARPARLLFRSFSIGKVSSQYLSQVHFIFTRQCIVYFNFTVGNLVMVVMIKLIRTARPQSSLCSNRTVIHSLRN